MFEYPQITKNEIEKNINFPSIFPKELLRITEFTNTLQLKEKNLRNLNLIYVHQPELSDITQDRLQGYPSDKGELRPLDWQRMDTVDQLKLSAFRAKIEATLQASLKDAAPAQDQASVRLLSAILAESLAQACLVVDESNLDSLSVKIEDMDEIGAAYRPWDTTVVFSQGSIRSAYTELAQFMQGKKLVFPPRIGGASNDGSA